MDELVTSSVNERSAAFGQLDSHRHIRFTSSEIELRPDGRVSIVHVLYTDLELSSLSPKYDANAVERLIARIKAFQRAHHQLIRLRMLSAPSPSLATMQGAAHLRRLNTDDECKRVLDSALRELGSKLTLSHGS
jgi:hypothetical protein